jgi:hypothetical protein
LGGAPWFFGDEMLRLFGMTTSSKNSNGDKENNGGEDNNKENNRSASASDPKELTASLSSPMEEEEGDDSRTGPEDPLLPRRIFCPTASDMSTPSSISAAPRIDSTVHHIDLVPQARRQESAVIEDPNHPCINSSMLVEDVNLCHVKQEREEQGDGGDSCASAAEFEDLGDATEEALQDRLSMLANHEVDELSETKENGMMLQRGFSEEIKITSAPPDFKPKAPNETKGEPSFSDVDNPGEWSEHTFRSEFAKKEKGGKHTCHTLPTGAVPVPIKDDGKREAAGWEFHCKGWKHDADGTAPFRSGASPENLFPKTRKGCLDAKLLKKMGLTQARMENEDALFFLQLLLPMCDPTKSGIAGDPRRPCHTNVEAWTQKHATALGLGGSCGHEFTPDQFKNDRRHRTKSRLCGDFGHLTSHLATFCEPAAKIKFGKQCVWCGELPCAKCLVCDAALHDHPRTGENKGEACSIHCHDEMCFGLGCKDHQVLHKKAKPTWLEPATQTTNKNRQRILALKEGPGL